MGRDELNEYVARKMHEIKMAVYAYADMIGSPENVVCISISPEVVQAFSIAYTEPGAKEAIYLFNVSSDRYGEVVEAERAYFEEENYGKLIAKDSEGAEGSKRAV